MLIESIIIASFPFLILKILLAFLAVVGMILLLIGLHHYIPMIARRISTANEDMDDTIISLFRKQVDEEPDVISEYNLFRRFLENKETPSIHHRTSLHQQKESRASRPAD